MIWLLAPMTFGSAAWQALPSGLDRLWETAPLTAALLGGLWILFGAYRGLVDRVVVAIENNTAASTRVVEALDRIDEKLDTLASRVTALEAHERGVRR